MKFTLFLSTLNVILKVIQSFDGEKIILNTTNFTNNSLADGIRFFYDNFFFKIHITSIILSAVQYKFDAQVEDLKGSLLANHQSKSNYIFSIEDYNYVKVTPHMSRNAIVVLIDSFKSFTILEKSLTSNRFNLHGHYLFVLIKGLWNEYEMRNFTSILWTRGIINFNVIYKQADLINFSSIRPFNLDTCSDLSLRLLNTFKNGKFQNNTKSILFPRDKFRNIYQCPIRVVTFERCPSICYENKQSFSGYDYEVIRALEKKLNFKLDLTYLPGVQMWGTILPNGSTTGGLDVLRKGEADIGLGNYILRLSRLKLFDASVSYYSIPMVLVIPPPPRYTPFEKLLQPFEKIIWILLGIVFSIGILTIAIINYKLKGVKNFVYGRKVKSPVMNMLVAVFGLQQTILPTRNFARFILMMFLLFCLVNRNVYQGALYIFLQSDGRHKEIQSIDEMHEKEFNYYVYATYADLVSEETKIYQRRIVINSDEELPYTKEVDETLKAAFMAPLTNVMNRNEMARGKFALRVCKDEVSIMNVVMFMAKGFFLKDIINSLLLRYDSSGLLLHWFDKYAQKRYLNMPKSASGPLKLSVEHLFGIFNIMLIGHGVAVVIFICEHLIVKVNKFRAIRKQAQEKINQSGKSKRVTRK